MLKQFPNSERRIFAVQTPDGPLHFDPYRVRRRLMEFTGGELNAHLDQIDQYAKQYKIQSEQDGKVQPAVIGQRSALEGKLADAAFHAFELSRIDPASGTGYTEGDVLAFLNAFIDFEQKKSPNTVTTPTSSAPTGSRLATPSPTSPATDCGCN